MANCSKPACSRDGAWVLAYDYAEGICVLEAKPQGELSPHLYLLCERCADRLRPPMGWTLLDRRDPEPPRTLEVEDASASEPTDDRFAQPLLFGESA